MISESLPRLPDVFGTEGEAFVAYIGSVVDADDSLRVRQDKSRRCSTDVVRCKGHVIDVHHVVATLQGPGVAQAIQGRCCDLSDISRTSIADALLEIRNRVGGNSGSLFGVIPEHATFRLDTQLHPRDHVGPQVSTDLKTGELIASLGVVVEEPKSVGGEGIVIFAACGKGQAFIEVEVANPRHPATLEPTIRSYPAATEVELEVMESRLVIQRMLEGAIGVVKPVDRIGSEIADKGEQGWRIGWGASRDGIPIPAIEAEVDTFDIGGDAGLEGGHDLHAEAVLVQVDIGVIQDDVGRPGPLGAIVEGIGPEGTSEGDGFGREVVPTLGRDATFAVGKQASSEPFEFRADQKSDAPAATSTAGVSAMIAVEASTIELSKVFASGAGHRFSAQIATAEESTGTHETEAITAIST